MRVPGRRPLTAAVLLAVLAACGAPSGGPTSPGTSAPTGTGDGSDGPKGGTVSAVAPTPSTPPPGSTSTSQSSATAAAPDPKTVTLTLTGDERAGFATPSANIGCAFTADQVSCGAVQADWAPPAPQPDPGCPVDRISVLTLHKGQAGWVTECRGDPPDWQFAGGVFMDGWFDAGRDTRVTVAGEDRAALNYGYSMQQGTMRCSVAETGVTCTDLTTRHGFTIARAAHSIF